MRLLVPRNPSPRMSISRRMSRPRTPKIRIQLHQRRNMAMRREPLLEMSPWPRILVLIPAPEASAQVPCILIQHHRLQPRNQRGLCLQIGSPNQQHPRLRHWHKNSSELVGVMPRQEVRRPSSQALVWDGHLPCVPQRLLTEHRMPAPTRQALILLSRRDIAAPARKPDATNRILFRPLRVTWTTILKKKCVDRTLSNPWLYPRVDSDPTKSLPTSIVRENLARNW